MVEFRESYEEPHTLYTSHLTSERLNKQDRQCKLGHVHANIVVVESDNITHSGCVFVALVIQKALHMRHIVICSLFSSSVTIFEGEKK